MTGGLDAWGLDRWRPDPASRRTLRVVRGGAPDGELEMVSGDPDPRLRDAVVDYTGYRERSAGPLRRRDPAGLSLPET